METKLDNDKRNPAARKRSFPLGAISVTQAARLALTPKEIVEAITRHARGDWGEVEDDLWDENNAATVDGGPIFSMYSGKSGFVVWVITDANRSKTRMSLLEEY